MKKKLAKMGGVFDVIIFKIQHDHRVRTKVSATGLPRIHSTQKNSA